MSSISVPVQSTQSPASSRRAAAVFLALAVLLTALFLYSLTIGRYPVPLGEIVHILLTTRPFNATQPYTNAPWVVVEIVRLPRILSVVLCGMGLAMAGAAAQGIFRNALVSPEIMGVSSGASFGGVIAIFLGWGTAGAIAMAFGFGSLALASAFALSQLTRNGGTLSLVLSGIVIGGLFSAGVGLVTYLADPATRLPQIVYWLLGSFVGTTYNKAAIVAAATLVGGTGMLALSWRINVLSLGEVDAVALGVNYHRLRWTVIALIALLVAAQVSISGVVAWVGLIVPHLARMLIGPEHSKLLPASALLGGAFLLGCDDITRSVTANEIPIGLLTAAIGTPLFAYLFYRHQTRGWARD